MSLKGKVTIITGASRGIGRALAQGFAAEEAVVVAAAQTQRAGTGVDEGSLEETVQGITAAGGSAVAVPCDVADEGQVKALVERTLAEVGPIGVLINNAGIWRAGPIWDFDTADWDRVMAVNMRGLFLMCKYVLTGMMERRRGNIINLTSGNAIMYVTEDPVYGPSKIALERFTLNLAEDVKPYNIAVNALSPGLVASSMNPNWDPSKSPTGRIPSPPEVVFPPVAWLAQQDASTFTGQIVHRYEFGKSWP